LVFVILFFAFVGFALFSALLLSAFYRQNLYDRVKRMLEAEEKLKELSKKYQELQVKVEKLSYALGEGAQGPKVEGGFPSLPIFVEDCDVPCALPASGPIVRGVDKGIHTGLDISVPESTFVFSTARGIVKKVGYNEDLGIFIRISHDKGYETVYGHLSKAFVKEGDTVKTGQLIGLSGRTGRTTGPHIHYEVLKDGKHIDPVLTLP
jgi:murein DD-endopeptidase MepM/ murein hydrolase activator NlpD